jgi:diadenosine tetraphosphate (Ap4A) HIT family hydrolase
MPREKWDALVRGEECPLCLPSPDLIAELRVSRLVLARNQAVKGYCIAIYKGHLREPYELEFEDRTAFWEDILQAGSALERLFGADKMNFEILGNGVPHLHCHIKPRYYGDQWPSRPVPFDGKPLLLDAGEYETRAQLIREALQAN